MKARTWTLAPLVALALGMPSSAEEIRGVIAKVDRDKKQLTVEGRGRGVRGLPIVFDIGKETRVFFGREPGATADLEPGQHVRVFYEVHAGRRMALSIGVRGGKTPTAPAPAPAADANTVTGKLIRVALTDREIVVVGPGPKGEAEKETTVQVPEKARITKAEKPIKLDDLKEGERVVVRTEKHNGKLSAVSIRVGEGPAAPARAESKIDRLRRLLKMADSFLEQLANPSRQGKP